jgi:hypothetical protein
MDIYICLLDVFQGKRFILKGSQRQVHTLNDQYSVQLSLFGRCCKEYNLDKEIQC